MGKKLAIKGHPTRGKEVIELLEMMGGKNRYNLNGLFSENAYYCIGGPHNDEILGGEYMFGNENIYWFTLEEFLKKYPFKVGDKVMDGYGDTLTIKSMSWSVDFETMVYDFKDSVIVLAAEDLLKYNAVETKSYTVSLTDDKAIGHSIDSVQFMQSGKIVAVRFNTQNYENEVELQLDDYEIEIRNGKTYAVHKKPKYPTTYEECCEVIGISRHDVEIDLPHPYQQKMFNLFKLRICRDAYWKIAGEEMGLDKPWEPDWNDESQKYCIHMDRNKIVNCSSSFNNRILAFPTEEMRDTFFKNFKDLIKLCKELL